MQQGGTFGVGEVLGDGAGWQQALGALVLCGGQVERRLGILQARLGTVEFSQERTRVYFEQQVAAPDFASLLECDLADVAAYPRTNVNGVSCRDPAIELVPLQGLLVHDPCDINAGRHAWHRGIRYTFLAGAEHQRHRRQ
ncbi:hypothetical protein D9M69_542220 [compost metagenome]